MVPSDRSSRRCGALLSNYLAFPRYKRVTTKPFFGGIAHDGVDRLAVGSTPWRVTTRDGIELGQAARINRGASQSRQRKFKHVPPFQWTSRICCKSVWLKGL
jgi:hypothetical protein